jgi:cytochrome oxidase Cu insertion factor (SCO1/SenC/PrrC family)
MSRRSRLVLAAGAAVALLVGAWAAVTVPRRSTPPAPGARAVTERVEDLMMDLQLIPLDGPAPALSLEGLDGRRVTLADLAGRPALIYFWATW